VYFNLSEADCLKSSDALLRFIEETISFIKEKGGDAKLSRNPFGQITFEGNKFQFNLDVSISLLK